MEPTPGVVIASRYRVLKELGRGGMGAVYLVEHVNTGERLALKALLTHVGAHEELVERFRREARTPSRIRSEHVVKVTDADAAPELGGAPFMVMELLEGQDLDQRLSQRGPLSPAELLEILSPVADVLDQAHRLGIVHRDLKPENLFLHYRADGDMVVKVVDFGIAKLLDAPDSGNAQLTGAGMIMGTPLYMAPEQARGDVAAIGPATDVWAIGQLAYNALTGQNYWHGPSTGEVVAQILTSPLAPPSSRVSGLPAPFDSWFARSCAREPAQRWPSAGAQLAGLQEALAGVAGAPTLAAVQPPTAAAPSMPVPQTVASTPMQSAPMHAANASPHHAAGMSPAPGGQPPPVYATSTPATASGASRGLLLGLGALLVAAAGAGAAVMLLRSPAESSEQVSAADDEEQDMRVAKSASGSASSTDKSGSVGHTGKPHVMSALNGGAPGYYEPQQLLTLIEPHLAEARSCYADELAKQPDLKGTVFLTLILGADHRPMSASCVPQMEGGVPRALCPCLQGKVTSWQFPAPKKRLPMISVGYKFIYSQK